MHAGETMHCKPCYKPAPTLDTLIFYVYPCTMFSCMVPIMLHYVYPCSMFLSMMPIALHFVYPCTICSSVWCRSRCIVYIPVLYVLLYGADRAALCISLYYMFFCMVPIALHCVYPCTICYLYGTDRAALCISLYYMFFCVVPIALHYVTPVLYVICMVPIALHYVYSCTICSPVWCRSRCIVYIPVLYVLLYGTDRSALCISLYCMFFCMVPIALHYVYPLYYMFFCMVPIALHYVYPCTICSSVWCRSRCIVYIPVLYVLLYGTDRAAICISLYYMFFCMVPIALHCVYPCTICSSVWWRSRCIMLPLYHM